MIYGRTVLTIVRFRDNRKLCQITLPHSKSALASLHYYYACYATTSLYCPKEHTNSFDVRNLICVSQLYVMYRRLWVLLLSECIYVSFKKDTKYRISRSLCTDEFVSCKVYNVLGERFETPRYFPAYPKVISRGCFFFHIVKHVLNFMHIYY